MLSFVSPIFSYTEEAITYVFEDLYVAALTQGNTDTE
jgi:hypothetical protein